MFQKSSSYFVTLLLSRHFFRHTFKSLLLDPLVTQSMASVRLTRSLRHIGTLSCFSISSLTACNVAAESLQQSDKDFTLDISKENELLKQCIGIAMEKDTESHWTSYDAGNASIKIQYKFLPNDSITTIRGFQSMDNILIESDDIISDYYAFLNNKYEDVYKWEKICDELCIEKHSIKTIDDEHDIVYSSHHSGVFGVSSRDFCYVKSRHLIEDFVNEDGDKYVMVCSLCYSLDEYMDYNSNHVRGKLKNCGYLFMKNKINGQVTACYVLHLDPGGWLPTWVINIVAPKKGMMVNKMHNNYHKIREFLASRV